MLIALHQPQYLPWIGFFHKIDYVDILVFQDNVQYKHRDFQNGNYIKTTQGKLRISIPVLTHGRRGQLINQVMIDCSQNWRRKHWATIQHNYRRAPFFNQYEGFFKDMYSRCWKKLIDINLHIIKFLFQELSITTKVYMESQLHTGSKTKEDRIIAVCKILGADTYYSGAGGKDWMDRSKFDAAGIKLMFQEFHHPVYPQLHGDFVEKMSIIDLLYNVGPACIDIVRNS